MEATDLLDLDEARERVLLCGQPTIGKTYALFALADFVALRHEGAKVYVLDADRGMGKVRKEWPQVTGMDYNLARSWSDVEDFMTKVEPLQKAGDWILIDMLGRFWEMAQSCEVGIVHSVTVGQRMVEARKELVEAKKLQAPGSLPQPDWTVIKKLHNDDFIDRISTRWDAHLVATTSIDPLQTDASREDPLIMSIFKPFGWKPDGEKRNVHRFDTTMFMDIGAKGRRFTTIKDRGRPLVERVRFEENLWDTYAETMKTKGYAFAGKI